MRHTGSFGWVIATDHLFLWACSGTSTGWFVKSSKSPNDSQSPWHGNTAKDTKTRSENGANSLKQRLSMSGQTPVLRCHSTRSERRTAQANQHDPLCKIALWIRNIDITSHCATHLHKAATCPAMEKRCLEHSLQLATTRLIGRGSPRGPVQTALCRTEIRLKTHSPEPADGKNLPQN